MITRERTASIFKTNIISPAIYLWNQASYRIVIFLATVLNLLVFTAIGTTQTQINYPNAPILKEPAKGVLYRFPGTQTPILFSWEPVNGATAYEINVVVNIRPAASTRTTETSIRLDLHLTLQENQAVVSWSVRAFSGETPGNISEIFTFAFGDSGISFPTTTPLPSPTPTPLPTRLPPPELVSPPDGAQIPALTGLQGVTFEWKIVAGANRYRITVYQDNQPDERYVPSPHDIRIFWQPVQTVYQWEVRSIDKQDTDGYAGPRFSFTLGADEYPTPTPVIPDADLNHDGKINAADLYLYAASFMTNDSRIDYNHTGLNDRSDLIRFLEIYLQNRKK